MAVVKACAFCGEPFVALRHQQMFCCKKCCDAARLPGRTAVTKKAKVERERKAARRQAFLARRDAEYAANAASVKVEERDGVRVETRGCCPCASRVGVYRQFVTDKGVAYVM